MRGNRPSWIKILFGLLLLVGIPVFVWAVMTQRIELRKKAGFAGPTLAFNPNSISGNAGELFSAAVILNSDSVGISGAELHLAYNPQIVHVTEFVPGSWLPVILSPAVISTEAGTIAITLGSSPSSPASGSGILGTVKFSLINNSPSTIGFSQNTIVTAVGQSTNALAETSPVRINGGGGTPNTPTPTPSESPPSCGTPCNPLLRSIQCGKQGEICVQSLRDSSTGTCQMPGAACGGIQGLSCSSDQFCLYTSGTTRATYPDESGTCQSTATGCYPTPTPSVSSPTPIACANNIPSYPPCPSGYTCIHNCDLEHVGCLGTCVLSITQTPTPTPTPPPGCQYRPSGCTDSIPPHCSFVLDCSSTHPPPQTCTPLPVCAYYHSTSTDTKYTDSRLCGIPATPSDGGTWCPRPSPEPYPTCSTPDGSSCSFTNCPICTGVICPRMACRPVQGICVGSRCYPIPTPAISTTPTPPAGCYYTRVCTSSYPEVCHSNLVCPPTINPICTNTSPSVTLTPTNQSGNPGDTIRYLASVKNNDTAGCQDVLFTLSTLVPNGYTATLSTNSMTLPPQGSTYLSFYLKPPATNTNSATQTVPITFTAKTENSLVGSADASFTFIKPIPVTLIFKLKLAGITGAEADGKKISITFAKQDNTTATIKDLPITHIGNGIYQSEITIANPPPANVPFTVLVKGPKHGAVRFCSQTGQTGPCQFNQFITTISGTTFDFTGRPLPAGDLNIDNVIDTNDIKIWSDIVKARTKSQQTDADRAAADINFDGSVNNIDLGLIQQSLSIRTDE